jgi:hypothetical protein
MIPLTTLLALVVAAALPALVSGFRGSHPPRSPGLFRDVTRLAGLSFRYDNDASGAHRFVETTGGGCAWLDYDNDGRQDIFAVQGGPAPGGAPRWRPPHALYRNEGAAGFRDVTRDAGLALDIGYGQGTSAADYDNDSWTDLLITTYGGVELFHNRRGRFERVTTPAGLRWSGEPHWGTSAAWADYDRDGRLDLFVCRYVSWFPDVDRACFDRDRHPIYCSPTQFAGDTSTLYHNEGDGTFRDVSARAGLRRLEGRALGAAWLDADGDGWPDLFVANDLSPNWLLRNNGDGTFEEVARRAGVSDGPTGQPLSGMGVAVADFDADGQEDLFVTNFSRQPRSYFRREGPGLFRWFSHCAGVGDPMQPLLGFGVESADCDLDGNPDLVVGNGHLDARVEATGEGVTHRERQQLLRNRGDGGFVDDRDGAGDLDRPRVTRGLAIGDYDDDGRPDVLVSGPGDGLALFRGQGFPGRQWIGFRLVGRKSARDALGARIQVSFGGHTRVQTVRSGSSYASRSEPRCRFGIGAARLADRVEVVWPRGQHDRYERLPAGGYYLLTEGGRCAPDCRAAPGPLLAAGTKR